MKRTKHNLGNFKLTTFDPGELVPVKFTEVLPGDVFKGHTSMLMRLSPLLAPVMHPVTVRLHSWYVPMRLIMDEWEDFITGGQDGEGGDFTTFPTISSGAGFTAGSLPDYLGLPIGVAGLDVSALPIRAYNYIFNRRYRDQDLVTEVTEDSTAIQRIAWERDRFTAARPWPQRGPEITLPLGTSAPVEGIGITAGTKQSNQTVYETGGTGTVNYTNAAISTDIKIETESSSSTSNPSVYANLSLATAATIRDLREAFALQRYQEARARYGSRYVEYLRALGIRPSDARLQEPEYLGGGKQTVSFTEVLQTGVDSTDSGVGEMKGHGIAAMRSRPFVRMFEEHGVFLTLASVRPKTLYMDGIEKFWSKTTKEEYFQRELEHIGDEEILNKEIYADGSSADDEVFGYGSRYYDYRGANSFVSGDFRSTLNHWHMARSFASLPALNQSLTDCSPSKRIHADQSSDVLWCMVQNRLMARRIVGRGD